MRRLKFLRIEKGLSQREIAAKAKMSNVDLCRIESGRINPNDRELNALGTALGCDPDRLMDHVSEASLEPGAEARDDHRA